MDGPTRARLSDTLRRTPRDVFAVVDGAHFDDLPSEIRAFGLTSRALYHDAADAAGIAAGPHLVPVPDDTAIDNVVAFVGDRPAAVFWSWPDGEDALYRHLRKLNRVEIPLDTGAYGPEEFEPVLFRHADPNVLAAVLPILELEQFGELLGAARGLVMVAPDLGGLKIVPRPKELIG